MSAGPPSVSQRRSVSYILHPARRRLGRRPVRAFVGGYLTLIGIGWLLLLIPASTRAGQATPPLDALFTAVSAVTVTGLVVVDTLDHWSPLGQIVILGLIQAGGLGIISGSTLLLLFLRNRHKGGLRGRMLVQQSTGAESLGLARTVLRRVIVFTLAVEAIGAAVLSVLFLLRGGTPESAVGSGIFYAVSGFNNAGFDLSGNFHSLIPFQHDPLILTAIGMLVVMGGLGFAVCADALGVRRWRALAVETRLVLVATAILLLAGFLLVAIAEWDRPETLGSLPPIDRLVNAAFTSVTLRTAGFTSLPLPHLADGVVFSMLLLMFIGGASGSTAGGVKVGTISVIVLAVVATIRGRPFVGVFNRRIPFETVMRAVAVVGLSSGLILIGWTVMASTGRIDFRSGAFEVVSAVSTVGLSMDLTPQLGDPARVLDMFLMVVGKLGPLTVALALASREHRVGYRPAVEHIRVG